MGQEALNSGWEYVHSLCHPKSGSDTPWEKVQRQEAGVSGDYPTYLRDEISTSEGN